MSLNQPENSGKEDDLTLKLLEAIDQRGDVTQRHLSRQLGVALGLTNSYLKRCIRKGLIKFREVPTNRYFYYLTPKGFSEKTRLTGRYLSASFNFYRNASNACGDQFLRCRDNGWSSILLCGVSELAEIAYLRGHEQAIGLCGVYDGSVGRDSFFGLPVYPQLALAPDCDCYLLTELREPHTVYSELLEHISPERILIPEILRLRSNGQGELAVAEDRLPSGDLN